MEPSGSLVTRAVCGFVMAVALFASQVTAADSWRPVWTLGAFDGSSVGFQQAVPVPINAPAYVVGKSDSKRDWHAFQPGSANGPEGRRPHPAEIQFDLPARPAGVYRLRIAILIEHPRISALDVAINGHAGRFYPQPKLDFRQGDLEGAFFPEYSSDTVEVTFPARFLRAGLNHLTLAAVDEPEPGDQGVMGGTPAGDSGLVYDALELDNDPAGTYVAATRAWAASTIYYRQESGQLKNLVDVFASYGERPKKSKVELLLNGQAFTGALPTDREFGEFRTEFSVPEFSAQASGTLRLSLNGHTQRFAVALQPGKKWNLLVVPHEHLDVGFTDYQAKVSEVHARVIDEAMEFVHQHPDFRFSLDGDWVVEQFVRTRTKEERNAFLAMVKDRKLFLPSQYANLLTGVPTAETLIRSLYAGYFRNQAIQTPVDYANIADVPSYSWSYASVLAAAGLKYFIAASNNDRAPVLLYGHLNEKSPFWWEGPDGSKILMWYSRHYHQVLTLFGLPPQIAAGHDSLPVFLQMYDRPDYRSDAVILFGTQPENTDLYPQQAALAEEWNHTYAYPKLVFSGFSDAMEHISKQFGSEIPTVRGDGGPYWEDGIASDAYYVALGRENEVRALSAEKFATLSTLIDHRLAPDRETLDQMWRDLILMDEHTWTADMSVSTPHAFQSVKQLAVKDAFATEGRQLVNRVIERSLGSIANSIQDPHGTFLVFNSLNWKRAGWVNVDLADGYDLADRGTGQSVPYEVLFSGGGYRRVRFLASGVPGLGYKAYVLKVATAPGPGPEGGSAAALESPYYRVELDPASGAIRSIYDKQLKRELVDASSPYRFGQYVYVTGADQLPNRLVEYSAVYPAPEMTPHPASEGKLLWVKQTPFGTEARLESSAVNTPRVETTILLPANAKKIELTCEVDKQEVFTREGTYFAFPFSVQRPEFHYEIQNGVVDPARNMYPGAGLEWFTVQHWAAVSESGVAAAVLPLDAPLVTLGDIVRGAWPKEFGERKGTIFSYLMNNYWHTNYRGGQGGHFTFRYVVTSAASLDESALSRLGWEAITPLEVDQILPQDQAIELPRPLDPSEGTFLQISNPNVMLTTWKQAEDGKGLVLRLVEFGGQPGQVRISSPLLRVSSAWLCNAVEVPQQQLAPQDGSVTFDVRPHQIVTLRAEGTP